MAHEKYYKPGDIWRPDEWKAMGFLETPTQDGSYWEIALIFETKSYAEQVFAAISNWQAEHTPPAPGAPQDLDKQNAIQLSFIMEADGDYSAYIYPTLLEVPSSSLTPTITICKSFPGGAGSFFRRFTQTYKGDPFLFTARYWNNENPQWVRNTKQIWKTSLKLKKRSELAEDELEYVHGKAVMGL